MCHKPLAKPPLIVSGILRASREQTFVRIAASVNMGSKPTSDAAQHHMV